MTTIAAFLMADQRADEGTEAVQSPKTPSKEETNDSQAPEPIEQMPQEEPAKMENDQSEGINDIL
jgi:hypothetical protein